MKKSAENRSVTITAFSRSFVQNLSVRVAMPTEWPLHVSRVAIPSECIGRPIAFAIEQPDDVDVNEIHHSSDRKSLLNTRYEPI
jgi:hypothetical protein